MALQRALRHIDLICNELIHDDTITILDTVTYGLEYTIGGSETPPPTTEPPVTTAPPTTPPPTTELP